MSREIDSFSVFSCKCGSPDFGLLLNGGIQCNQCGSKVLLAKWDTEIERAREQFTEAEKCIASGKWKDHELDCDCSLCDYYQPRQTIERVRTCYTFDDYVEKYLID